MLKLFGFVGEYKKEAMLTPVFVILEVALEIGIPYLMSIIVDLGIKGNSGIEFIAILGICMVVMAFFSMWLGGLAGRSAAIASCGFAQNIRKEIFYRIQNFSFENIDKYSTSSLITRLTTDINSIQMAFQITIRMLIRAPFMFMFGIIMAISLNAELSLVLVAVIPVLAIVLFLIFKKAMPNFKRMFKKYDKLNNSVQENLIGIRVVKAYVREEYEKEKFMNASDELLKYSKKAEKIVALNMPIMQFMIYLCIVTVLWLGSDRVYAGTMGVGALSVFITYINQILSSLMMISMALVMLSISRAAIERATEVISEVPTMTDVNSDLELSDGSIEFRNVDFSYSHDVNNLNLENVNLKINSGETVGILGGTGSAKSTFVQLIPRLYDVEDGEVIVGKHNVKDYNLKTLRDNVAMVLQNNTLFSGSIINNLRWGKEDAKTDEIVSACKSAQAHDFIESFEEKYDRDLGQGGVNVSGGQKQRLCIARAMIKKPKILILDDSTSAVDTKTDAYIRKAFAEDIPNTTKIIIAQRISSIQEADKIIIMDKGKILDVGKHDELLARNDVYKETYLSQMKGADENE